MDAVKNMWNKYREWLGDKVWYKNWKVWLSIIVVLGVMGAFVDDDAEAEADEPEMEEVAETVEADTKEEATENTVGDEEDQEEENEVEVDDELISEINEEIARMVEWDHGLALGTMDGDGNEIEDGEPDEFYAHTLYISDITYDGSGLELQTNADFLTLSDDGKKIVANHAQNVAQSVVSQKEEWDVSSSKHTKRLFLTIMNGEVPYGRSQVLDPSEFKWNK